MALGLTIQEIIECGEFPLLVVHDTWQRVLLDDVATVQNGYAFSSDGFTKSNGMPLIRIRDINRSITQDYFNGKYPDEYVVNAGDILIGMDGDFNIARWKGERALLNQRVCRLKHSSEFYCEKFLVFVLPSFLNAINAKTSSVTVKHLSSKTITEIQLPLPPLAEQHRIVSKIEELFSELDNGVETLNKAKQQLKIYRQAVLKYAFEGKLTNPDVKEGELPEGWDVRTVADVTESLSQGWSPKCDNKSSANESEWAVITTTAIQHIKFSDKENKVLPKHLEPRTQHELVDGDVLITRAGPRNRVGVCCLVKEPRKRLLNCDKAYRIKVKRDRVLPSYLVQVLNTSEFLGLIDKCKSGGNDSGLNLTQTVFSSIRILIPRKLSEQEIILGEIESRLSVCDKIEESIDQGLKQAEALRQSILKRAFEGKLVPQDVRDENASILLERIKAERAESQPQKKIKAKKNK